MKKYLIAFTVIILAVVAFVAIKKHKDNNAEGIGKDAAKHRPPRLRIVYSKKLNPKERNKVTCSDDVYKVLREIWSNQIETREEIIVLLLDRSNNVLGCHVLSSGGITGTVADIRLLFGVALQSLATSIKLAHNYPSGNLLPSKQDLALTKKLKETGIMMDITLLAHLIVTKNSYYSFNDEGNVQAMKNLIYISAIIFTTIIISSCTPQKRPSRLIALHPELTTPDTVKITDTIITQKTLIDSAFHRTRAKDTITIEKEKLSLKIVEIFDTNYIQAQCNPDTIV